MEGEGKAEGGKDRVAYWVGRALAKLVNLRSRP